MPFFACFLDSLSRQSNQDFDLLLFNDGVPSLELAEQIQRHSRLNTLVVDVKGSIASIRKQGLEYLKQFPEYQNFIFGDSDDFFSENLIERSIAELKKYDILIRDLNIVDEQGKQLIPHFWGGRLNHGFEPDIHFLLDQNIMGLGNVAMRSSCLQAYAIDEDHAVVDWTLFCSMLLKQPHLHIFFDSRVQTNYRQHADSITGLTKCNPEKIEQARQVKVC
jgi:glycosyltransferase involved in cell wall biosynthesis